VKARQIAAPHLRRFLRYSRGSAVDRAVSSGQLSRPHWECLVGRPDVAPLGKRQARVRSPDGHVGKAQRRLKPSIRSNRVTDFYSVGCRFESRWDLQQYQVLTRIFRAAESLQITWVRSGVISNKAEEGVSAQGGRLGRSPGLGRRIRRARRTAGNIVPGRGAGPQDTTPAGFLDCA
jgi:hypothetical protein